MSATKSAQSSPKPPAAAVAAAVAADPHWAATQERLRNRTRPVKALTICDDLEVKNSLETARHLLRRAQSQLADQPNDANLQNVAKAAEADVAAAQEAFDAVAIVLRFQALRRPDFEDLKKAHPPTEAQAEDGDEYNVETLGPELIAAASLDGITVDDAVGYLTDWAEGEAAMLFNTAWFVQSDTRMDLGKG